MCEWGPNFVDKNKLIKELAVCQVTRHVLHHLVYPVLNVSTYKSQHFAALTIKTNFGKEQTTNNKRQTTNKEGPSKTVNKIYQITAFILC